jgi:DNA-binding beta-propeller fold protein YncE/predicted Ser/Thr protein kinase
MMAEMALGSVFAGHRIESVAGRGGMGVVYSATQLALDRKVALKVIAPGLMDDDGMRRRFVRESKVAASIDHPNVIPIYYAGEDGGIAYIAMRYVAGDDLRSLVRREGRLEPRRAARIVSQIAAALDAAHAAGLVHRDVKPANVLLGPEDHVYLTDFGLTKHALSVGSATKEGHWVGTLDYVAPEQIRGERVDARADVYALGCVLFLMLTGEVPFRHEGEEARLWAHLSEDPPAPSERVPGLPYEMDEVIARAMAKQPDDRFPSAGDLGRATVAALAGQRPQESERLVAIGAAAPDDMSTVTSGTVVAEPAGRLASEAETRVETDPGRRRRLAAAGAVVAALAVGVVVGAVLLSNGNGKGSGKGNGDGGIADQTQTSTPPAPKVVARIPVGDRPNTIAATDDNVFVGSFRELRLSLISTKSNSLLRSKPTVGRGVAGLQAGGDSVWVAVSRERRLLRLDARTGRRIGQPIALSKAPNSVAVGETAVWVGMITTDPGGNDTLARIDPKDGGIANTVDVPEGIKALAASPGAVWIASRREPLLLKVSIATGKVVSRVSIGRDRPSDIAYAEGVVWLTYPEANTVARVDARTGRVIEIGVEGRPQAIAAAGDQVWVANYSAHTVTRIDTETKHTTGDPVEVELNPYELAIGGGDLWVTCVGEDRVVRVALKGRAE